MSVQSASNVVPLLARRTDHAEPSARPADGLSLVQVCRDQLIHGATTAFAEGLAQAHEDLLSQADRATKLETQQLCFTAHRLLATRGQELLERFRTHFVEGFDRALEQLCQGIPAKVARRSAARLELVDCDDFERDLAIDKLGARAVYNCSQQLTALDRRLAVLLRAARISQDDNPFHPKSLFTAFLAAVRTMEVDRALDLILLQQFEQQTAGKLPGVYGVVNRHLAANGVLPNIAVGSDEPAARLAHGVDAGYEAVPPAGAPAVGHAVGCESPAAGAPSIQAVAGEDIFARLLAGLQAAGAASGAAPLMPAVWANAGAPSAPLLDALTALQRTAGVGLSPLAHQGRPVGAGSVGLLHRLRAAPTVSWSQPVDLMMLDLVAMLFDLLLDDRDLHPELRAELAKLQIPVLKVALMDKGLFSNKRHPARRLLDTIAGAATGWADDDRPRLHEMVRDVVETILAGFETDIGIFARESERLAGFLAAEEARVSERVDTLASSSHQEDDPAIIDRLVAEQIARRTDNAGLPPMVARFLDHLWRLVLVQTARRSGDDHAAWDAAIASMDDLVWSVTPKTGQAERQRLMTMLPGLLERLHEGLVAVGREDEWAEFSPVLIDHHMQALRSATSPVEARPSDDALAQPGALRARADEAADVARDAALEAEATAEPSTAEDRHLRMARSLSLGTWVEFRTGRGTRKTLRLSWVSGLRGVYLFTNRQGQNGLTIAVARLAEYLRQGSARVLGDEPLTEPAVAQMLERSQGTDRGTASDAQSA